MALVDYGYTFLAFDVGVEGRISYGGVLKNSAMCYAMEDNTFKLPSPRPLPLLNENFYNTEERIPLPLY